MSSYLPIFKFPHSYSDSSQANPNDIVEGVLTKALSGGKAKREKAARKAEARKQEASASSSSSDGKTDSSAKPDEVMEKLYKSLKEAEAHGLLQGLGKEMMREFAKEIGATTTPTTTTTKAESESNVAKGAKSQSNQQTKQQPNQQQQDTPKKAQVQINQLSVLGGNPGSCHTSDMSAVNRHDNSRMRTLSNLLDACYL